MPESVIAPGAVITGSDDVHVPQSVVLTCSRLCRPFFRIHEALAWQGGLCRQQRRTEEHVRHGHRQSDCVDPAGVVVH